MRAAAIFCVALAACGFSSEQPPLTIPPDAPIDTPPGVDPEDPDGDGVLATDNCPGVANTAQEDRDGDGVGDACDNCAAVMNAPRPTPGEPVAIQRDHDGDDRGDECDLCPHIASAGDVDPDADGIGTACDPEPMVKNPPAYFNGFYDLPDATWSVPAGSGTLADWEIERRGDALGWRQRVLDGSKAHQIMRAGATQEHFIDSVMVVESIALPDGVSTRRGAEVSFAFDPITNGPFHLICGVQREGVDNDFVQAALLQNDVVRTDKLAPWPTQLQDVRIRVVGQATRVGDTEPKTGTTALSCVAGDGPTVTVTNAITRPPDGQLGLRTFGMTAWFDYVFHVDLAPAPPALAPRP